MNVNTFTLNGQSSQTVVQVRYASRASDDAALGAEQDKAAKIVWENALIRLSAVMVTAITHQVGVPGVGGVQTSRGREYSREELASRYGPRPAGLDNQSASGVPPVVANLLAVLFLGGVVAVVGAVVVFLVVLAFRRRRRPASGAGGPPGQQWPSQWQGPPTPDWGAPGPTTSPPPNEVQPGEGGPPAPGSSPPRSSGC